MKTISLRVDVDTLEGSLQGIPALLRMLDRQQLQHVQQIEAGLL